jgi:phosphonate transport system substrate-binding protein
MKNKIKLFTIIILPILILIFAGCTEKEDKRYNPTYSDQLILKKQTYIFGIHPLHNPKRLFEVYQPLIDYLNQNIPTIHLKLEASRNYETYNKKLFSGYFDFSLPNPYQTVQSLHHGYTIFGKMGDDENFRGLILVRKDSKINDVKDLKGKTVSYPASTALAATMLPQYFLTKQGINITKDIKNIYVGSQESSIMNLYLNKSQAAATWPPPWIAFSKKRPKIANELMIKWETNSLPNNGLIVKSDISQGIINEVSELLFNLHKNTQGKKILQRMELSKFEKADKNTYSTVIEFLKTFEKEIRDIGGTK